MDLSSRRTRSDADLDRSDREPAKRRALGVQSAHADILSATAELEGIRYHPRTLESRSIFDMLLSVVHGVVGDVAQDVLRSAADAVLEILKDEDKKDLDRKRAIEDLIGQVSSQNFTELVALGKKITDYNEDDDNVGEDGNRRPEIDDDVGVAVVFDEEAGEDEMEEDNDQNDFEVRDFSDEESEDGDKGPPTVEEQAEDAVLIGSSAKVQIQQSSGNGLEGRNIDGFWLQRTVSQSYSDAHEASEKSKEAFNLLSSESNKRDCENALMELFDYDKFDLVKLLLQNRDLIVWCTTLARAEVNERPRIETVIREKGLGWILKELSISSKGSLHNGKGVDGLETGEMAKHAEENNGKLQPQKVIDIESMIFSQGPRLMSNKKCRLPEGSFKRTHKGYEEVHVPAPTKAAVLPEELVPIEKMPAWAQPAFGNTKTLNRVQSRMYSVAFGSDEPILLCAPTGAGKVCSLTYSMPFP